MFEFTLCGTGLSPYERFRYKGSLNSCPVSGMAWVGPLSEVIQRTSAKGRKIQAEGSSRTGLRFYADMTFVPLDD